jgi:signal transduction histidine kinase
MNNGLVGQESGKLSPQAVEALRQNTELIEQLSKQTRTISHLLHPPLLDEIGLLPAIRMFAEGFGERSNVKVTVDLSPEVGRLPPTMEISIFRIVQECLTNVYRHSESKTALIRIRPSRDKSISVQVCDEGKGIPSDNGASILVGNNRGVGLSGMRERVRELGGTLDIHSNEGGTTVTALLPVANMAVIDA